MLSRRSNLLFKHLVRKALQKTYPNRAIPPGQSFFRTAIVAFAGLQVKYKYTTQGQIVREWDRNLYNWAEQIIFLPARLIKNTAKLGTEFIWNLATEGLALASQSAYAEAGKIERAMYANNKESYPTRVKILGYQLLGFFAAASSYLLWVIAKLGQSITSPFAAMKESYAYFARPKPNGKPRSSAHAVVGFVAAGIRGLISIAAYAAIAVFAAPVVGGALIASGSVGTQLVTGLSLATSWISSLPVISTLGSVFVTGITSVGSALGLSFSLGAGFASAAAIASTAIAAAPALASLKAFVRWISPSMRQKKLDFYDANTDSKSNSTSDILLNEEFRVIATRGEGKRNVSAQIQPVSNPNDDTLSKPRSNPPPPYPPYLHVTPEGLPIRPQQSDSKEEEGLEFTEYQQAPPPALS